MPPGSLSAAADVLARWLPAACTGLVQRREELNSINVFPIADADTGNNVHLTVQAGADAVDDGPRAASRAMLFGACGNSGSIVASFFSGWATATADGAVTAQRLAAAIAAGEEQARSAVSDPMPGTILSVLAAIRDAAAEMAVGGDVAATYQATYAAAEGAVRGTTAQLKVLADAGVVDAGAAAWLVIWHSLADALGVTVGPLPTWERPALGTAGEVSAGADEPSTGTTPNGAASETARCSAGFHGSGVTELLVTFMGDAPAAQAARAAATAAGDSVVLVTDGDLHRLHVHTVDADRLMTTLRDLVSVQDSHAETILERDRHGGEPGDDSQ